MSTHSTERSLPPLTSPMREVFEHWLAIKGNCAMPRRGDINPAAFRTALPHIWIYRLAEDGDFICVLAGEEIQRAWNQTITGKPARDFLAADYDSFVKQRWLYLLHRPAFYLTTQRDPVLGKRAERMALPLAGDGGEPERVLGISIYSYDAISELDEPIAPAPTVRYFDTRSLLEIPGPGEA